MSRLKQVGLLLANLVFYAFLAAYWYLATNLPPWHALVGALLSYGLFLALRDRLRIPGPSPLIVALAGVLFFFMFSPLPSLRGLSQMLWLVLSAVLFRLCFSQLAAFPSPFKISLFTSRPCSAATMPGPTFSLKRPL